MNREDVLHGIKIIAAVVCIAAVFILSYFAFRLGQEVFSDEGLTVSRSDTVSYELTIEPGEAVLKVGFDLKRHHIIRSALAFQIQSKVFETYMDPGTYTVTSRQSSKDIIKYLNQQYELNHQDEANDG